MFDHLCFSYWHKLSYLAVETKHDSATVAVIWSFTKRRGQQLGWKVPNKDTNTSNHLQIHHTKPVKAAGVKSRQSKEILQMTPLANLHNSVPFFSLLQTQKVAFLKYISQVSQLVSMWVFRRRPLRAHKMNPTYCNCVYLHQQTTYERVRIHESVCVCGLIM